MAQLSPEINQAIWDLKRKLLEIINTSKSVEFNLLAADGETNETVPTLDQLQTITEKAIDRFSRLSTLQLRIAEAQPILGENMLAFITEAIIASESNIPALKQSIEEIRQGFNL
jgi:hypothetical protein